MAEEKEKTRAKSNEYHKQWVKKVLGTKVQTYAHLEVEDHARVQRLAERQQMRIPQIIGKLVRIGLDTLEMREPPPPFKPLPAPTKADLATLTPLILASRFPNDSEMTRYRLLGTLNLIHLETMKGNAPIANHLARVSKMSKTHMNLIAAALEKRGLIERVPTNAGIGGKRGVVLRIRDDATQAFQAAHLAQTGEPIGQESGAPPVVARSLPPRRDPSSDEAR